MPFSFQKITSTQSVMKEILKSGKKIDHLDYVIAEEQTEGRGRQGRAWESMSGNLMVSIFISEIAYPPTWLPHWISLSVVEALKRFHVDESRIQVKWPNDVLIDSQFKISGVICEKVDSGVIAGIGVNILHAPMELSATSLHQVLSVDLSEETREAFLRYMLEFLKTPLTFSAVKQKYRSYSLLSPEEKISWIDPSTQIRGEGTFVRYGEHGEIWVRSVDGGEKPLYSEEIHLMKRS